MVKLEGKTLTALSNTEGMGLAIFYAKDEKEAAQFMMNGPAVKNKIMAEINKFEKKKTI